jgi:hypothetical protein
MLSEVYTNITDKDESEPSAYEQLKTLLMSSYTKAHWTTK